MTSLFKRSEKKEIDKRLGALYADLETLQTDMKKLAGGAEGIADDRLRHAVRHAETVAKRGYHLAQDAVGHASGEAEKWAQSNIETARTKVRSQPLSALAASLGAGAVLGIILGAVGRGGPRPEG